MAQELQFIVLQGPSKFDLMTAVFVGQSDAQIRVKFGVQPYGDKKSTFPNHMTVCEARILGVEREDGSGERWIVKGYLYFKNDSAAFSGYYTTQDRTGHFNVIFS